MAPKTKKNDDDFVLTISDNEDEIGADYVTEELIADSNPSKKRKRNDNSSTAASKKSKKSNKKVEEETVDEDGGIWGSKDEDDGAMDSDFEFALEADGKTGTGLEEFEGWGFDSAKKGLNGGSGGDKKAVDIDEIIARRREKRKQGAENQTDVGQEGKNGASSDDKEDEHDQSEELALEDEGDEFMAEDGFGMGAGSEPESGDEEDSEAADDEELADDDDDSDNDSVASPAPHPDDVASEEDASDVEEDADEDPEEAARREAFFAPEEKPVKGAKSTLSTTFQSMSLSRPILRGLGTVGFTQPTPIQSKTIPVALLGKDVVGGAITGSGKTAAFIVPILERLLYRPKKVPTSRVAILMPTRELAIQCHAVATKLASHTDIKFCLAVGGLSLKVQEAELRLRPDVIIATPGRFIDHMRNSPSFTVDTLEILVLDEADRMLEAGFADELNEILTTIPKSRQTMLFSATMTSSVDNLIRVGLNRPVRLMVDSQKQTAGTLVQEFIRLRPGREGKRMGYLLCLCKKIYTDRVIVFFRQKKEAHRARVIFGLYGLKATELHGSMSQEQVKLPQSSHCISFC
jgi:ATP-dependent RNA helicase DDX27